MAGSFDDFDGHFDQIKSSLTDVGGSLLLLPDYAEVGRNILSMGNYLPLIRPLILTLSPSVICEIGAYRGITTRALAEISREVGASLHVVDPAIDAGQAPVQGPEITYFKMISEQYLAEHQNVDLLLIDGDHNYEVVSKELSLIADFNPGEDSPVLVMHDVGWPWAYRDLYYDRERIQNPQNDTEMASVSLTRPDSPELQISIPLEIEYSTREGGPGNGVRCAIEDFLTANPDWRFINIPSLFGMGLLWNNSRVSKPVKRELKKLAELFDVTRPFLSTLEFNRLLLLSEIAKEGEEWQRNQEYITEANVQADRLNEDLKNLCNELEEANSSIRNLHAENIELGEGLSESHSQLSELGQELSELNQELSELNQELSKSAARVAYLESLKGATRQAFRRIGQKIKMLK